MNLGQDATIESLIKDSNTRFILHYMSKNIIIILYYGQGTLKELKNIIITLYEHNNIIIILYYIYTRKGRYDTRLW